jgi:hypothetical protein
MNSSLQKPLSQGLSDLGRMPGRRFLRLVFFSALMVLLVSEIKAATTTAFDGTWSVTQSTSAFKTPDGSKVRAWTQRFSAYVKNGSMHGERGTRGAPGWFEINGNIEANGAANLGAHGVTAEEKNSRGQAAASTPYEYLVAARFKAQRGSGRSVGSRVSTFTFVKQ